MTYTNNATQIIRELLTRVAALEFDGRLEERINYLPVEMAPRYRASNRCCVHKDRAVLRYRAMAVLGFHTEDELDETVPLSEYARRSLEREDVQEPMLTVIDEACSSCIRTHYFITNACRGCVARPCTMNCPKKAISMRDGHAEIDSEKCINCGICLKQCPYHAIIYVPIPCEEACPVGAITKGENGKEVIDYGKCIYCGKCLGECPFGAIMERSQIVDVIRVLQSGRKTSAVLAPAIAGQFNVPFGRITAAVKALGFDQVVEAASGADRTSIDEAREFEERMAEDQPFITTSCCPAYTGVVEKHIEGLKEFVSSTPSPMAFTAREIRNNDAMTVTVFIGPCVAKRKEAFDNPDVDYVLTFEELACLFEARGIKPSEMEAADMDSRISPQARGFAQSGGVMESVKYRLGEKTPIKPLVINGLTRSSLKDLKNLLKEKPDANFVEVMSCEGGCIGGPCVIMHPRQSVRPYKLYTGLPSV